MERSLTSIFPEAELGSLKFYICLVCEEWSISENILYGKLMVLMKLILFTGSVKLLPNPTTQVY